MPYLAQGLLALHRTWSQLDISMSLYSHSKKFHVICLCHTSKFSIRSCVKQQVHWQVDVQTRSQNCEMPILASSRLRLCLSVRMEQMGGGDVTLDVDDVSNYYKNLISINYQFVPHTEHSVLEDQSCYWCTEEYSPFCLVRIMRNCKK
jgi:hypothetical protein